ncbi:MAG: HAD-IC family P-type ATPase [Dehalococcoidales bacterium]|nr:HAD-IC family P-type ATPase [Dehalococcoidales bacterium]
MNDIRWHQLTEDQTFEQLSTNKSGLGPGEVQSRLKTYGYNEIISKRRSWVVRLLMQFNNPLLYVLMVAAAVGLTLHFLMDADTLMDTWVILGVVVATAVIGFIQEGKAESSLEALKKMMVAQCNVIREGQRKTIPTREVVPGDIVILEDGDRVPADLRLFNVRDLYVEEAALTGESLPVEKNIQVLENPDLSPGDRLNMCFSGTFISRGRGQGIAVATGDKTVIGQIAHVMQETKKIVPPIMRKISVFTRIIIIICVAFGVVNFALGTVLGYDWSYMLLAAVAVIVAMIPEGLAGAIIAAFAVGAIAMSRRNALIKRLPAAETLGCTTVICSDKTGTLTRNEMTVQRIYAGGRDYRVTGVGYEPSGKFMIDGDEIEKIHEHECLLETLRAGVHCNNAELEKNEQGYDIKGDPTEGALVVSAAKAGLKSDWQRIDEIPFNSELMYMATLHNNGGKRCIYIKGSPEKILSMCSHQQIRGETVPLRYDEAMKKASEMAHEALRVMGFACKYVDSGQDYLKSSDLKDMTFLGLQGMIDPPRLEAIEAVKICKIAGIRVVMITGDHTETARAVARELGIVEGEGRVVSGQDLEKMSEDELRDTVKEVSVYARVAPEHKFRIVDSLQKHGQIVAVTGDGVNDAPALKRADIGIAMGITGTEVSKEAADMVLTDDNFASIVAAVEEGRHVFTNIWKVILYLLPTNGGQGLVLIGAVLLSPWIPVFALRLPIEPVQILWVNLIIAIGCSIPLIWEPKEKGILGRPPRDPDEKLFNSVFVRKVVLVSLISAVAVFGLFLAYTHGFNGEDIDSLLLSQAQTVAFTTLIMVQLTYLFTARSVEESAFTFNPFSNRYLLIGAAITLGLQLLIIYSDSLFGISPFRTAPFPAIWWVPIILVSVVSFLAVELEKGISRRIAARKTGHNRD